MVYFAFVTLTSVDNEIDKYGTKITIMAQSLAVVQLVDVEGDGIEYGCGTRYRGRAKLLTLVIRQANGGQWKQDYHGSNSIFRFRGKYVCRRGKQRCAW